MLTTKKTLKSSQAIQKRTGILGELNRALNGLKDLTKSARVAKDQNKAQMDILAKENLALDGVIEDNLLSIDAIEKITNPTKKPSNEEK